MVDTVCKRDALQAITNSDKLFLTPADVAPVLGTDPHTIRCTARQRPELLGFNFTFSGNRMKIPRIPFLRYMGVYSDYGAVSENSITSEEKAALNAGMPSVIIQQIRELRKEINQRLDALESQIMATETHGTNTPLEKK